MDGQRIHLKWLASHFLPIASERVCGYLPHRLILAPEMLCPANSISFPHFHFFSTLCGWSIDSSLLSTQISVSFTNFCAQGSPSTITPDLQHNLCCNLSPKVQYFPIWQQESINQGSFWFYEKHPWTASSSTKWYVATHVFDQNVLAIHGDMCS